MKENCIKPYLFFCHLLLFVLFFFLVDFLHHLWLSAFTPGAGFHDSSFEFALSVLRILNWSSAVDPWPLQFHEPALIQ